MWQRRSATLVFDLSQSSLHGFHSGAIDAPPRLNHGLLPRDYYALAEQHMGGYVADVLTLRIPTDDAVSGQVPTETLPTGSESVAVMDLPKTSIHESIEVNLADLRRSVAIRHVSTHRIVALLEIISPANKDREESVDSFVHKSLRSLAHGIHVLMVDIFAPGKYDPHGMHYRIRQAADPYLPNPVISPRLATLATYQAGRGRFEAFIEHPNLGEPLPKMAVFLEETRFVYVPLEETYARAWDGMPLFWRNVVASNSIK
ncbi:MAG: DUF4058 family protein [Pirellula sp.]